MRTVSRGVRAFRAARGASSGWRSVIGSAGGSGAAGGGGVGSSYNQAQVDALNAYMR